MCLLRKGWESWVIFGLRLDLCFLTVFDSFIIRTDKYSCSELHLVISWNSEKVVEDEHVQLKK